MYNEVMNSRQLEINHLSVNLFGERVIYVMSRDQRVRDNHALVRALEISREAKLPLVVVFNVLSKTGDRSKEHYQFMYDGLKEVQLELEKLNIGFILFFEDNKESLLKEINKLNPAAAVFDFSPLNGPKDQKNYIAKNAKYKVMLQKNNKTIQNNEI